MQEKDDEIFFCLLLIAAWPDKVFAGEKGWFGFGASVKGEGFFLNPTVLSATVDAVQPHSPAAEKSIAVGDEIIQVANTDVPGHKARELKPLMEKQVGETLHLRLKRKNGKVYSVTLVAVKQPS